MDERSLAVFCPSDEYNHQDGFTREYCDITTVGLHWPSLYAGVQIDRGWVTVYLWIGTCRSTLPFFCTSSTHAPDKCDPYTCPSLELSPWRESSLLRGIKPDSGCVICYFRVLCFRGLLLTRVGTVQGIASWRFYRRYATNFWLNDTQALVNGWIALVL